MEITFFADHCIPNSVVTFPPQKYNGIIALQVKNRPETLPQILDQLKKYLAINPKRNYYRETLIIIETYRIRIKK